MMDAPSAARAVRPATPNNYTMKVPLSCFAPARLRRMLGVVIACLGLNAQAQTPVAQDDAKENTAAKEEEITKLNVFTVEATKADGSKVTVKALQLGTVDAVVRSTNGFVLDLGALGRVDFKNVQQII